MKTLLILSALVAQSSAGVAMPTALNTANANQKLNAVVGLEVSIPTRNFKMIVKNFDDYTLTDVKATNRVILDEYRLSPNNDVVVKAKKSGDSIISIYGYKTSTFLETGKKAVVKVGTKLIHFDNPIIETNYNVLMPVGSSRDLRKDVLNYQELANPQFTLVNPNEKVHLTKEGILTVDRDALLGSAALIQVSASNTKTTNVINTTFVFNNDLRWISIEPNLTIRPASSLDLSAMLTNYAFLTNPVLKFDSRYPHPDGFEIINNSLIASPDANLDSVALTVDADNAFRPANFSVALDRSTPKPEYVEIKQKNDLQIYFNQGLGIADLVENYDQLVNPEMSFDIFTDHTGFEIVDNILYASPDAKLPSISVLVNAKNAYGPAYITITAVEVNTQPIRLTQLNYTLAKGSILTVDEMLVNANDLRGLDFSIVDDHANNKMWYDHQFNLHVTDDVAPGAFITVEVTATNSQEHKFVKLYADTVIELKTNVLKVQPNHTYYFSDMVKNIDQLVDLHAALSGTGIWDVDLFNSKGILTVGPEASGNGTITISATNALSDANFTMIVVVE